MKKLLLPIILGLSLLGNALQYIHLRSKESGWQTSWTGVVKYSWKIEEEIGRYQIENVKLRNQLDAHEARETTVSVRLRIEEAESWNALCGNVNRYEQSTLRTDINTDCVDMDARAAKMQKSGQ